MPTGALSPVVRQQAWKLGIFSPGAKLYSFLSGTSTPQPVYTDAALTVPASNPLVADSTGRFAVFYLAAVAYRFRLDDSADVTIWGPHDDIYDFAQLDAADGNNATVLGTAGVTIAAGQVVYISDGSGGNTAGRWYLADADFTYASTLAPKVGVALTAITSGQTGLIAVDGRVTGLSSLVAGTTYYVSATAGALTSTAPTNARIIGTADSTTSLVLANSPVGMLASVDNRICDGRLTLTTGTAVTTADVTGATSAFFTPYTGNRIVLYDGTNWNMRTFSEITISLAGLTASRPYDVFAYDNAGVVTIETLVWTNATTRATALALQDGVLSKSGQTTRRYIGSIYINGSGGQTDDTLTKRYVYNYLNRAIRTLQRLETTSTWNYTTATYRQANGAAANQVEVMVGVAEDAIDIGVFSAAEGATASFIAVGVGLDSTSAVASGCIQQTPRIGATSTTHLCAAYLKTVPTVGLHTFTWLEWSTASGTTTWQGTANESHAGIIGTWRG